MYFLFFVFKVDYNKSKMNQISTVSAGPILHQVQNLKYGNNANDNSPTWSQNYYLNNNFNNTNPYYYNDQKYFASFYGNISTNKTIAEPSLNVNIERKSSSFGQYLKKFKAKPRKAYVEYDQIYSYLN